MLSAGYHDAWYVHAQKVRQMIKQKLEGIFSAYDFIALPTTPTTAFKLDTHNQDPLSMYLADLYTVPASIAGIPAMSIPNGTDKQGLPIGLQVMAPAFQEDKLLAFASYFTAMRPRQ